MNQCRSDLRHVQASSTMNMGCMVRACCKHRGECTHAMRDMHSRSGWRRVLADRHAADAHRTLAPRLVHDGRDRGRPLPARIGLSFKLKRRNLAHSGHRNSHRIFGVFQPQHRWNFIGATALIARARFTFRGPLIGVVFVVQDLPDRGAACF